MQAIYLSEDPKQIKRVYNAQAEQKIATVFDFRTTIYTKEDLGGQDFSSVTAIFSTWGMPALTREEIKRHFPSLKYVFYAAGSVQYFAKPFLDSGVRVFSAWKANAVPVAEYAVSQILLANKGFYQLQAKTKQDRKAADEFFSNFTGNYGAKVGLLGDGAVGSLVLSELLRYELEIYLFSITMSKEQADALGVRLASLEEIFAECDVISNHLANNEQTKGMLNAKLIDSMKDYATLINTGRGAQVDERALCDKLTRNPTVTAVLDVTYPEPPAFDSPLLTLPNVFLTPHIAGSAGREVQRMAAFMADECVRVAKGEQTQYEVTASMLAVMA